MANIFPRWTNWIPLKVVVCVIVIACALTGATWYYATPKYTKIGYQPIQPVPFPHDIHVAQLGMDCRYCHSFVEVAAQSNVPNTATCMNCHTQVAKDNPKLQPVQESWKSGEPVEWVWIYRTVDYVYYNHSAHVNPASAVSVATAQSITCRWFTSPNPTAWRGAWIAIGTPKIICGRTIRFSISIGNLRTLSRRSLWRSPVSQATCVKIFRRRSSSPNPRSARH